MDWRGWIGFVAKINLRTKNIDVFEDGRLFTSCGDRKWSTS